MTTAERKEIGEEIQRLEWERENSHPDDHATDYMYEKEIKKLKGVILRELRSDLAECNIHPRDYDRGIAVTRAIDRILLSYPEFNEYCEAEA